MLEKKIQGEDNFVYTLNEKDKMSGGFFHFIK